MDEVYTGKLDESIFCLGDVWFILVLLFFTEIHVFNANSADQHSYKTKKLCYEQPEIPFDWVTLSVVPKRCTQAQ